MTEPGPPGGVERRRERIDLSVLTEDVRTLEESTALLARAVTKIVPDQIQIGTAEIRRLLLQIVGSVIASALALFVYSVISVSHLEHTIDHGHDVLICIEKLTVEQRTDQAILTCKTAAGK